MATYTETDKARVYVVLTANDGNVKRTARETRVPEQTVRRWRDEWEKNGPPSTEEVEQAAATFVDDAVDLRELGMQAIRLKLELLVQDPKAVKIAEITTLVGVLTDKIDRASGLDVRRVDHQHHLPPAEEIRELMAGFVTGMKQLSADREAEIVDAEIVEQPALPPGK